MRPSSVSPWCSSSGRAAARVVHQKNCGAFSRELRRRRGDAEVDDPAGRDESLRRVGPIEPCAHGRPRETMRRNGSSLCIHALRAHHAGHVDEGDRSFLTCLSRRRRRRRVRRRRFRRRRFHRRRFRRRHRRIGGGGVARNTERTTRSEDRTVVVADAQLAPPAHPRRRPPLVRRQWAIDSLSGDRWQRNEPPSAAVVPKLRVRGAHGHARAAVRAREHEWCAALAAVRPPPPDTPRRARRSSAPRARCPRSSRA